MAKNLDDSLVNRLKEILKAAGYKNPTVIDLDKKTVKEDRSRPPQEILKLYGSVSADVLSNIKESVKESRDDWD